MDQFQIKKALELLTSRNGLIEARVIGKKTVSGYFKDPDKLITEIAKYDGNNIYIVLNEIEDGCYSREQSEKMLEGNRANKLVTTSDKDIVLRDWLLIDVDPERPSGVSATDEEKSKASDIASNIYKFLRDVGFENPILADSGNGYHLLYKINLLNNEKNTELIKNVLNALDMMFSDESAKVDTSVFNAARITKLYGTKACKGADTKERPHRVSKILSDSTDIKPTTIKLLQKVAAMLPVPEKPSFKNNYSERFDLQDFIHKHNIRVDKAVNTNAYTKYILEECLFDPSHKAPDAMLTQGADGAVGYKCLHASCQDRHWQDVRRMFEPGCYDNPGNTRKTTPIKDRNLTEARKEDAPIAEGKKAFLRLLDIQNVDRSKIISIQSGVTELDKKIIGFNKGELSIWSGANGSGKSSVLSQFALEAINNGFNVAVFSGELTSYRMKNWLHLQAAGRQFVKPSPKHDNVYYTPDNIGAKIDEWSGDKLWLYNNDFGLKIESILGAFKMHIDKHPTDMIIIDNLMALDMSGIQGDKYDKQTNLVMHLSDFAKKYNVHIHFVCHPRKSVGFLRKTDISGTADITNIADNVLIVHRVNNDFKRLAKEFLGEREVSRYEAFDNCIEVCKNRDLGVVDCIVGMYYEMASKRFLNDQYENKVFGWQELFQDGLIPIDDAGNPFIREDGYEQVSGV